ncbi:MAG: tetratricopeptide repeat protein [Ferruginibacter sp.]
MTNKVITLFCLIIAIMNAACTNKEDKPDSAVTVAEEQQLKNEIVSHPDSLLLTENLVQYYRDNGNYGAAIKTVNSAINKDSINPRLWDMAATLHFENRDTLSSIIAFEKAIDIYPDPVYIISLGTLYAQTKNEKALALADALLMASKSKADKEAYFIKGLYYNYTGNKNKAIVFFDKCLSLSYTFMDAYREKAIALYDLDKYNEALAVLDKAVTLQNNFDEGYFYMGRCLEKLNRKQEAVEAYQKALMYDPGYSEAKDALAKLGYKQ